MKLIRIITKHLPLATVAIMMAACASEDFVGNEQLHEANENGRPVSFDLVAAPQTRAVYGGEAAGLLNNNFVVWGDKVVDDATQTVFNNYQINYTTNTANTSTTNSAGWEYIGCNNVPHGVTTNEGVTTFAEKNGTGQVNDGGVYQTIKYWDFSATKYNFFAYSLGEGYTTTDESPTTTYATSSAMTTGGYSLSGSVDELSACYISDKVIIPHASLSSTNTQVSLQFRKLGAKVKIALYETIPGYSVKNVRFYRDDNVASGAEEGYGTTAYLYAADGTTKFNRGDGGTFAIAFDTDCTPNLSWTEATTSTDLSYISFGDAVTTSGTTWTGWQGEEYWETAENVYIGRSLTQATGPIDFVTVLPYPEGTPLSLKVDFTLLSRDDSKEVIEVTGAKATVPAQFVVWKPNCSYTYIFKISDDTPGQTAPGKPGLYPITLDAVVNVSADGTQETITTVTEPEPTITTYQKGSDYAKDDEYDAGVPIYIVVYNGSDVETLDIDENVNAKLYTVTNVAGPDAAPNSEPAKTITEENVANVLTTDPDESGNYVITDGNKWVMKVSTSSESLTLMDEVPAVDAPDGIARHFGTNMVAKFKPEAPTAPATTKYYVFQFMKKAAVAASPAVYTQITSGTDLIEGKTYYTSSTGEGLFVAGASATAGESTYELTTPAVPASPAEYQYKVIKVKAVTP